MLEKKSKGIRLTSNWIWYWSVLILLQSVASVMRKLLKASDIKKLVGPLQIHYSTQILNNSIKFKTIQILQFLNVLSWYFWLGFSFAKLLRNICGTKRKIFLLSRISFVWKKNSNFAQSVTKVISHIRLFYNSSFVQFRNFVIIIKCIS